MIGLSSSVLLNTTPFLWTQFSFDSTLGLLGSPIQLAADNSCLTCRALVHLLLVSYSTFGSVRKVSTWGLRGVRVGEARNPGPCSLCGEVGHNFRSCLHRGDVGCDMPMEAASTERNTYTIADEPQSPQAWPAPFTPRMEEPPLDDWPEHDMRLSAPPAFSPAVSSALRPAPVVVPVTPPPRI